MKQRLKSAAAAIKRAFCACREIIIPTFVMICICIIITAALSGTDMITKEKIAQITEKTQIEAMSRVIDADTFTPLELKEADSVTQYYLAENSGEIVGYVFINDAKGYGGDVSVIVAVKADGSINAVEVLDVSGETPGLGQNAGKEGFYGQFAGLSDKISVVKNGADSGQNEINAVTGATVTSRAVTSAVNEALSCADKIIQNSNTQAVYDDMQEGGGQNEIG